jgi:ABC-type multidrug transport system ATPase subunit
MRGEGGMAMNLGQGVPIRCEGLSKTYGQVVALQDLDLTVETGTVFGFLGPKGAGKTTTIRLLLGLARPTQGRAWLGGQEVTADAKAARQLIGYLAEDPCPGRKTHPFDDQLLRFSKPFG